MSQTQSANRNEYRNLTIGQLRESASNPRRRFNEQHLNELADSLKTQGMLAPMLVRELEQNRFEVIAGARRFRAAKIAGLEAVPVRVVKLTDSAAIEAQVVENLQREDIHPLEEALGFRSLLELATPKYAVADIAARSGKSEAYVQGRVKLTELIQPVADAFLADQITIGHALLIAKLPASQQQEACNAAFRQMWMSEGNKPVLIPVKELAAWIQANILLELDAAPFGKEDGTLVPQAGSCANCPKRTGFNSLLFSEVRKDSCTDPQCFRAKVDAHIAKAITCKPQLVQISGNWSSREGAPLGRNRYVELQAKSAKNNGREKDKGKEKQSSPIQKPCRSMAEAIFTDGGRIGQTVKVCTDFNCNIHHSDKQQSSPEQLERERTAERKRIEAQKIEITTRHQVLSAVLAKVPSPLKKADLELLVSRVLEKLEYQRSLLIAKRHKLLSGRNAETDFQQVSKALSKLIKDADEAALCRLLMECVLLEFAYQSQSHPTNDDKLGATAKRYRIDAEKISRTVRDDFAARAKKAGNQQKIAAK